MDVLQYIMVNKESVYNGYVVVDNIAYVSAVIICGMWAVWSTRNARHHGEKDWPLI